MFLTNLFTGYILPMVYDSLITLLLVLFFLFIFRIKDSNIRILFFFLPLIKSFLIILKKWIFIHSTMQPRTSSLLE